MKIPEIKEYKPFFHREGEDMYLIRQTQDTVYSLVYVMVEKNGKHYFSCYDTRAYTERNVRQLMKRAHTYNSRHKRTNGNGKKAAHG